MITVEATVAAEPAVVWQKWNNLADISQWAFAGDDWAAEGLRNDLTPGGELQIRTFARDGSESFIYGGVYDTVVENELLEYTMDDGRKVKITFEPVEGGTKVTEQFDSEDENSADLQRRGWQLTLNNFKRYVEASRTGEK